MGRSGARSGRKREEGGGDAIVMALTVQIILCLVVLLSATIAKRMDANRFSAVQAEYASLVGQEGDLIVYFQEVGGFSQGFFTTVERAVQSLFGGAEVPVEAEQSSQADPLPAITEELVDEPLGFDYQYLGDDLEHLPLGAGGLNEVSVDPSGYLEAPEGSTLAPYYILGTVRPPVSGVVTSKFAYRYHPITDNTDFHTGVDIAAEEGRNILAALSGEVVEVGDSEIYGNYIILQHTSNLQTFYAHCSEIIAREGMAIRQGERIARVGQTGVTTGPHLHFSVLVDGLFVDPLYVMGDYLELLEE